MFGEGDKKPAGILLTELVTYRNVSIWIRVGHRQLQAVVRNSRACFLLCTCETGDIPGTDINKLLQFLNNQSQLFDFFLSCHCSSQLTWQRCRKMRVMNCSSSIQTSGFLSTIITGVCRDTGECNAAQGGKIRKHLRRAVLTCCIHSVGMVYQSGNTREAEQQDARSRQSQAGCP